ncbi:rhodanese-like domain-containing protein [Desulfurispira natronophila]|uniref:Rhodanese-related sulfurtransferase n=1 Tax=Desulfurispira natronophila TaxID=682562 RepID=A0A7W7Y604_9BACT|nr:rhodanese-like domain-containing protein [Desulfurispira natronophila]MBB5022731.1 rhodanese-related sulfurtransferase [Desulfurispira natronophila]
MRKLLLPALLLTLFLGNAHAQNVQHQYPSEVLINSGITIIDIRTAAEWKETGIIPNAHTITFFDEQGQYDARAFLQSIDSVVTRNTPFAIICRTGNRTTAVSKFLGDMGYQVINLQGGLYHLIEQGYQPVPYP